MKKSAEVVKTPKRQLEDTKTTVRALNLQPGDQLILHIPESYTRGQVKEFLALLLNPGKE